MEELEASPGKNIHLGNFKAIKKIFDFHKLAKRYFKQAESLSKFKETPP